MRFELPRHGDIKVVRRFAFLPTVVEDHKVWLEFYEYVYQYNRVFSDEGHWSPIKRRSCQS
jgi:hypothetical protein